MLEEPWEPISSGMDLTPLPLDEPRLYPAPPVQSPEEARQQAAAGALPRAPQGTFAKAAGEARRKKLLKEQGGAAGPTSAAGATATKPRSTSHRISLDLLEKEYDVPLTEVGKKFGLSITMLKKICRKYGIQRWPHRQIRSINRTIEQLSEKLPRLSAMDAEDARRQIDALQKKRELVTKGASSGIPSTLRNAIFMADPDAVDLEDISTDNSAQLKIALAPFERVKNNPVSSHGRIRGHNYHGGGGHGPSSGGGGSNFAASVGSSAYAPRPLDSFQLAAATAGAAAVAAGCAQHVPRALMLDAAGPFPDGARSAYGAQLAPVGGGGGGGGGKGLKTRSMSGLAAAAATAVAGDRGSYFGRGLGKLRPAPAHAAAAQPIGEEHTCGAKRTHSFMTPRATGAVAAAAAVAAAGITAAGAAATVAAFAAAAAAATDDDDAADVDGLDLEMDVGETFSFHRSQLSVGSEESFDSGGAGGCHNHDVASDSDDGEEHDVHPLNEHDIPHLLGRPALAGPAAAAAAAAAAVAAAAAAAAATTAGAAPATEGRGTPSFQQQQRRRQQAKPERRRQHKRHRSNGSTADMRAMFGAVSVGAGAGACAGGASTRLPLLPSPPPQSTVAGAAAPLKVFSTPRGLPVKSPLRSPGFVSWDIINGLASPFHSPTAGMGSGSSFLAGGGSWGGLPLSSPTMASYVDGSLDLDAVATSFGAGGIGDSHSI